MTTSSSRVYDFDIDNYEIADLKRFFGLESKDDDDDENGDTVSYSVKEIEQKKEELTNQVLHQSELPLELKQNMVQFFEAVAFRLQHHLHNPLASTLTSEKDNPESSFFFSFMNPMKSRQAQSYSKALTLTKEEKKYKMNKLIGNDTYIQDVEPTYLSGNVAQEELNELEMTYQSQKKSQQDEDEQVYPAPHIESHPIVSKPYTKFVFTENAGPYQGFLNPLERRIITRVLSIDSRFRTNYAGTTPNNFHIQLTSPVEKVVSMRLVSLELPRMWYTISAALKNNVFFVELYNMVDYPDSVQMITFPDGNYTNQDLQEYLNNYFTNQKQGLDYLRFDINVNNSKSYFYVKSNPAVDTILPYDPANAHYSPDFYYTLIFPTASSLSSYSSSFMKNGSGGKRVCEDTNPLTLQEQPQQPQQQPVNADYGFGLYLGFKRQQYIGTQDKQFEDKFSDTPAFVMYGVNVSESSCGVSMDNYIFLSVNDYNKNFNSNTIMAQLDNSFMGSNILGRICLNTLPDGLLINNPSDYNFKTREYFGPVKISKLQFSLLNKYGREINLLLNDYSLALEFQILYSA